MVDTDPPVPDFGVEDADAVLARIWAEIRTEPALAELTGLVPADRALGLADAFPLLTVLLTTPVLKGSERQLAAVDALGHAYARARGLHFSEGK